jgi:hypothetical protein
VRRAYSVPERLAGFGVAVGAAAFAWPTLTAHSGLGMPCPLRTLTGVPCPGCGLTTAAVALVHDDPVASVAANPAILVLACLTVVVVPLIVLRAAGVVAAPRQWSASRRRRLGWLIGLLALASWIYQLHRLGIG